jgi:hypothetical protein
MSERYGDSQADRDAYDRWVTREPDRGDEGDLDEGDEPAPEVADDAAEAADRAELLAELRPAVSVAMRNLELGAPGAATVAAAETYVAWVRDLRDVGDHDMAEWAVAKLLAWALDAVLLDHPDAHALATLARSV